MIIEIINTLLKATGGLLKSLSKFTITFLSIVSLGLSSCGGGTIGSGSLITTATAKRGEPYLFTLTMSDGSNIKYINRLPASTLTTAQAELLNFTQFTSDMSARFAAYNGSASNTLNVSWKPLDTALIFADAIYWNRGEVNSTARISPRMVSDTFSCPALATNYSNGIQITIQSERWIAVTH